MAKDNKSSIIELIETKVGKNISLDEFDSLEINKDETSIVDYDDTKTIEGLVPASYHHDSMYKKEDRVYVNSINIKLLALKMDSIVFNMKKQEELLKRKNRALLDTFKAESMLELKRDLVKLDEIELASLFKEDKEQIKIYADKYSKQDLVNKVVNQYEKDIAHLEDIKAIKGAKEDLITRERTEEKRINKVRNKQTPKKDSAGDQALKEIEGK